MGNLKRKGLGLALAVSGLAGFAGVAEAETLYTSNAKTATVTTGATAVLNGVNWYLMNNNSVIDMTCTAVTWTASVTSATNPVALDITDSRHDGCTEALFGTSIVITGDHAPPWVLSTDGTSYAQGDNWNGAVAYMDWSLAGTNWSGTLTDNTASSSGGSQVEWDNNSNSAAGLKLNNAGTINKTGSSDTGTITAAFTVLSPAAAWTVG